MKQICTLQIRIAVLLVMFGLAACTETKMVATMARDKSSATDAQAVEKIETIEEPESEPAKDAAYQPIYVDELPRSSCYASYGSGAGAVAYALVGLFAYSAAAWYADNGIHYDADGCSY